MMEVHVFHVVTLIARTNRRCRYLELVQFHCIISDFNCLHPLSTYVASFMHTHRWSSNNTFNTNNNLCLTM